MRFRQDQRVETDAHYTAELFESIFDALPANAALLDQDGCIVAVNEPWKTFASNNSANTGDFFIGANYLDVCRRALANGDQQAGQILEKLSDLLDGRLDIVEAEYPCHSPYERRWFRMFAKPLTQEGKRFAVLLHLNVTEKKIAEFSLKRQAEILNLVTDAIVVVNLDDEITYVNTSAIELYGWSKSEFIGKCASQLLYNDLPSDFEKKRTAVLERGRWSGEVIQVNRSGQKLSIGARWSLIRNEDGAEAILKVHTDMSLIGQFLRAQRMQTMGSIAGGVAHDLNNILAPILLLSESIQSGSDPNSVKAAEKIADLTDRASALLRQLLGFARGFEADRRVQKVQSLVEDAIPILKISLPNEIRLNFESSDEELKVFCNQVQIQQILLNLCLNARDAISGEGVISISLSQREIAFGEKGFFGDAKPGRFVCLSVADSGSGISTQDLDRIFEPFYSSKPVGQGTGLGLPTCLGIVKSHGGFFNVTSQLGKGSIFSVYIPLSEEEEAVVSERAARFRKFDAPRILVVDDEQEIRSYLTNLLKAQGFDVVIAGNGNEAVAEIINAERSFDLVLTDMNMPGMSGFELIQYLAQFQKEVRVVGMSGFENELLRAENKNLVGFLRKPFRNKELLSEIEKALDAL